MRKNYRREIDPGPMKYFLLPLFLLSLLLLLMGCGNPNYQYRSVSPDHHLGWRAHIPLYIDQRFTPEQDREILFAVSEWNRVLNGYLMIEIADWHYIIGSLGARRIDDQIEKTQQGIVLLAVNSNDPIVSLYHADTFLAFVNNVGDAAHVLVMIRDRISTRPYHTILMHELGHALGAQHVNTISLMFPNTDGDLMLDCVDKITASQIATYHHMDLNHLNYCPTPLFP
jgi:hypothetical protein